MRHFKGLVVAAFAAGIAIGGYATKKYFSPVDSPRRLDDRATTSTGIEPSKKDADSMAYRASLEGNGKNIANETIEILQGNQKTLEEKVLKYENENKTLKEELTKLRHTAGIYDFSDLKEPEDVKLEDRFAKSPVHYLGNFDKKYEDILSMVDLALKSQKNIRNRGFFAGGEDPSATMDFYDFGEMTTGKDSDRAHQYWVDIDLKDELVASDPFVNSLRGYEIGISIDKAELDGENGVEEIFTMNFQSEIHNIHIFYNATKMIWSEHASLGKIELPVVSRDDEKVKTVPKSIVLADNIIQGIEFIVKDIKK